MTRKRNDEHPPGSLQDRAQKLGLYGLLAHWDEVKGEPWLAPLIQREEEERGHRSLQRRVKYARLGRFKDLADFDWDWPKKIDRDLIEELLSLQFVGEAANVVVVGQNGVGKTMLAKNLAHRAVIAGHTVLFVTASELLNELAAQESAAALQRRLRKYSRPQILAIDELGYLSYDNRHADLLFEVVSRRYGEKSTVITTNKPFREWSEVFPNATCVVTIIDRLVHKAEVVKIDAESYRLKEAKERTARRAKRRKGRRKKA